MLKFPRGFFEEEEREGFLVEAEMKHVWAAQLEMIKLLEQLCEKNGFHYFTIFGTLLGAIRHQGFIPWDDDVDIAMIREEYQEFIQISQDQLPDQFWILSPFTEPEWDEVLGRIVNGRSINVSGERLLAFHGCPYAIGSDVFIIDHVPNDEKTKEWKDSIISLIYQLFSISWANNEEKIICESDSEIRTTLEEGLTVLEETFDFEFYKEGNLRNQLCCLFDAVCSSYGDINDRYLVKYPGYVSFSPNYYFHKSWFEGTIPLKFENTSIMAPIGYDAISYATYGYDYMIPRTTGAAHDYPFYKGQREVLKEKGMYEFVEKMREVTKVTSCSDNIEVDETLEKLEIPQEWTDLININGKTRKVRLYGLNSSAILAHRAKVIHKIEKEVERYLTVCEDEILILVEDLVYEKTLYDVLPESINRLEKVKKLILDNNGIVCQNTNYKFYEICDEYLGDCTSAVFGFLDRNIPMKLEDYKH